MKMLNPHFPYPLVFLLTILLIISSAYSPAINGSHKINAKGKGFVTGQIDNVTYTEADIIGGGSLNGNTTTSFIFSSPQPGVFLGECILKTNHGNLTYYIQNRQLGGSSFQAKAVDIEGSGTGKLAGAEGYLELESIAVNPDGTFTEDVTGELCFD